MKQYLLNLLVAIDQLVNTILGGDPDETISSRAAKRATRRGWKWIARLLETVDPGHLARVREDDEGGRNVF